VAVGSGRECDNSTTINKTKYLIILGIHKPIKTEFIIKVNENKLGNAGCY